MRITPTVMIRSVGSGCNLEFWIRALTRPGEEKAESVVEGRRFHNHTGQP